MKTKEVNFTQFESSVIREHCSAVDVMYRYNSNIGCISTLLLFKLPPLFILKPVFCGQKADKIFTKLCLI